jgi:iron complex outermembrane recepter protein
MRVALLSLVSMVGGLAVPVAAQAMMQSYHLNIPRQPLDGALKDLARQTDMQIGRFSDSPGGSAGPVSGDMSLDAALRSLLASSRLTFKVVNDHTIAVTAADSVSAPASPSAASKRTAQALTIAPETVKSHVKRIFLKLEVKNRAQAVSRAGAQGQIRTGGSWLQIS